MKTLFLSAFPGGLAQLLPGLLLYSIWLGLALAIVVAFVVCVTRRSGCSTRYNIFSLLFFSFPPALVIAVAIARGSGSAAAVTGASDTAAAPSPLSGVRVLVMQFIEPFSSFLFQNAVVIASIWLAFFLVKSLRLCIGLIRIGRIRKKDCIPAAPHWQNRLSSLCTALGLNRRVVLMESALVRTPLVIGHRKPTIYMPAGLLASLPNDQVLPALLHELGHIRRNDYLVNILQQSLLVFFIFNPGLLWVSSMIDQEREHCCDDIALAHSGSKRKFIEALERFAEYSLAHTYIVPTFSRRGRQLARRLTHVMHQQNAGLDSAEKIFLSLASCLFIAVAGIPDALGPVSQPSAGTHLPPPSSFHLPDRFEAGRPATDDATDPATILQHSQLKPRQPAPRREPPAHRRRQPAAKASLASQMEELSVQGSLLEQQQTALRMQQSRSDSPNR